MVRVTRKEEYRNVTAAGFTVDANYCGAYVYRLYSRIASVTRLTHPAGPGAILPGRFGLFERFFKTRTLGEANNWREKGRERNPEEEEQWRQLIFVTWISETRTLGEANICHMDQRNYTTLPGPACNSGHRLTPHAQLALELLLPPRIYY